MRNGISRGPVQKEPILPRNARPSHHLAVGIEKCKCMVYRYDTMIEKMTAYFVAEKLESLLFLAVGILAISVATWLYANGHRLKSMAYPLVAIAVIQIVVGGSVFFRTGNQLAGLNKQASEAPATFKAEETRRMEGVMRNFTTYKWIEIALLAIGTGLVLLWQRHDIAAGIGGGFVIQAAFMLCLDLFAEARGEDYLALLRASPG